MERHNFRHGLESNVLRFVAKMDTERPIEVDRRFTISYFLSDDTILVFEPPQRNSGIIGGKFLERGRVKRPDGSSYYNAQVRDEIVTFHRKKSKNEIESF